MMYEAQKRLDFIKTWDGTEPLLSDTEKLAGADAYRSLIESFIPLWMKRAAATDEPLWSRTDFSDEDGWRSEPKAHLSRWFGDRSFLDITMETSGRTHQAPRYNNPHVHYPELTIRLQGPGGIAWRQYNYSITRTSELGGAQLLRTDHRYNPLLEMPGLEGVPVPEDRETTEKYRKLFETKRDSVYNLKLEIEMGLNRLPVQASEIHRIAELIDRIDAETYDVSDASS